MPQCVPAAYAANDVVLKAHRHEQVRLQALQKYYGTCLLNSRWERNVNEALRASAHLCSSSAAGDFWKLKGLAPSNQVH